MTVRRALTEWWNAWRIPALFLIAGGAIAAVLVPGDVVLDHWRAFVGASVCGLVVGVVEIASRYRDEPFQAVFSPFGLLYCVFNGAVSFAGLLLILSFPDAFADVADNKVIAAMAAGFGAPAVLRTRLAILKGEDNSDISVGPDVVTTRLLALFDNAIDRTRAARRQQLVAEHLAEIRALGDFRTAAGYLLVSLLAFQNLDSGIRADLEVTIDRYEALTLPKDVKYLAIAFVFLTVVGERQFVSVLESIEGIVVSEPESDGRQP